MVPVFKSSNHEFFSIFKEGTEKGYSQCVALKSLMIYVASILVDD